MTPVGFEPTHPKIVELESTALDHSAKVSIKRFCHLHKRNTLDAQVLVPEECGGGGRGAWRRGGE